MWPDQVGRGQNWGRCSSSERAARARPAGGATTITTCWRMASWSAASSCRRPRRGTCGRAVITARYAGPRADIRAGTRSRDGCVLRAGGTIDARAPPTSSKLKPRRFPFPPPGGFFFCQCGLRRNLAVAAATVPNRRPIRLFFIEPVDTVRSCLNMRESVWNEPNIAHGSLKLRAIQN
jgi:hypothetical protein